MPDHPPLIPPRGKAVKLRDYPPDDTAGVSRETAEAALLKLRTRIDELQNMLYADRRYAVLVVLQGMDTAGKDGTVNSVFREAGPIGCSVVPFGVPTEKEKAHHYLWRYQME